MNRHIILSTKYLFLVLLISGCSSLQVKREVMPDNTFVSNNPSISIKVSPDFNYIGNIKEDISTSVSGLFNRDNYCFVKTSNSELKSYITIQFGEHSRSWAADFFKYLEKKAIAKGVIKYSGKKFKYCTLEVWPSMNSKLNRHIVDQGYSLKHGFHKAFGRVYGVDGKILVKIIYFEPIDGTKYEYMPWNNVDELTKEQLTILSEFDKRAELSFDFIE